MNRITPTQSYLARQARYNDRKNKKVEDNTNNTNNTNNLNNLNNFFQWGMGGNSTPRTEQEVLDVYGQDMAGHILDSNNMGTGRPSLEEQQAKFMANTEMFLDDPEPEPVFQPSKQPVKEPVKEPAKEPAKEPPPEDPNKKKLDEIVTTRALENPDLSNRQRQAIIDRYEAQHGKFNFGALLAGFGTAMQGKGASGTDDVFAGQRQRMQDELKEFDTNRNQKHEDEVRERERKAYEDENDPNSNTSAAARAYMAQMGVPVPANTSYAQLQKMFPYAMSKINLDTERAKIEIEQKKIQHELTKEAVKLKTDYGDAIDETSAKTVKDLKVQSESVIGNIRKYVAMMRKGGFSGAEKVRQQQMLANELASLDPALMPPAAREEWLKIIEDRAFEWNSTTAERTEELIDYIAGNARESIKPHLTSTALANNNSSNSLRFLGMESVRMTNPATGETRNVRIGAFDNAYKAGWREI